MKWFLVVVTSLLAVSCIEPGKKEYSNGLYQLKNDSFLSAIDRFESVPEGAYKAKADSMIAICEKKMDSVRERRIEDDHNRRVTYRKELKVDIGKTIDHLNKNKFSFSRETVAGLTSELDSYYEALLLAKKTNDIDTLKKLGEKLRKVVRSKQKTNLPIMRRDYGLISKNTLWQEDIEVYTTGSRNQNIYYVGGIFAANRNKQDYYNVLEPVLKRFKFKRVYFKWYSGDNGIYYTINPEPDDAVF